MILAYIDWFLDEYNKFPFDYPLHEKDIAAGGSILIYSISASGMLTLAQRLGKTQINQENYNFIDMSFDKKGDYLFALDTINGVHTFDITKIDSANSRPQSLIKVSRGDFVQVVDDSLNIIISQGKQPNVQEYVISYGADGWPVLTFNRKVDLDQSIKDVYSDSNYLYLITGYLFACGKGKNTSNKKGQIKIKTYDLNLKWLPSFRQKLEN